VSRSDSGSLSSGFSSSSPSESGIISWGVTTSSLTIGISGRETGSSGGWARVLRRHLILLFGEALALSMAERALIVSGIRLFADYERFFVFQVGGYLRA